MMQTMVTARNQSIMNEADLNLIQEDMPESDDMTQDADSSEEEAIRQSMQKQDSIQYVENYECPKHLWNWEQITDWKKRIAAYDDQQKKFYQDMVPRY